MGKIKKYNGHHCRNCWNISLWIGNDEGLYDLAKESIAITQKLNRTMTYAAKRMLDYLPKRTPDGAKYTLKGVRAALIGLME